MMWMYSRPCPHLGPTNGPGPPSSGSSIRQTRPWVPAVCPWTCPSPARCSDERAGRGHLVFERDALVLGFTTGLRPSSLRPLRRDGANADIKWNEGILLIRRSQTIGDEVMETTKTDLHQRLTLPRELLDVLRWHVNEQILHTKMRQSDLLFPSVTGGFRAR